MNLTEAVQASLTDLERSAETVRAYKLALRGFQAFLEERGTTDVSTLKFQSFIDYALQMSHHDYAKSTMQTYLSGVAYFLDWLMLRDFISPNQNDLARFKNARESVNKKRQKRMKKVPSTDTVSRMLDAVYTQPIRSPILERDIAILFMMCYSGCRVGDIVSLKVGDLDLENRHAVVIGKGDKERAMYFNRKTAEAVQEYWGKRGWADKDDPAFANHSRIVSTHHEFLSTQSVENVIQIIRVLAGVEEHVTPHSFRHYFITEVLRRTNGNLSLAKDLAGHENIATTKGYAEFLDSEIKSGYDDAFGD